MPNYLFFKRLSDKGELNKTLSRAKEVIEAQLGINKEVDIVITEKKRSNAQNAKQWAMLTEISQKAELHGKKFSAVDWKHIFTASLKHQRTTLGLNNEIVVLGSETRHYSVSETNDLIALMEAYADENGIELSDPKYFYDN